MFIKVYLMDVKTLLFYDSIIVKKNTLPIKTGYFV